MSYRFTNLSSPTRFWAYNSQGSPTSKPLSWLKATYSARKGAATRWVEHLLRFFWQQERQMAHPVLTKGFYSQAQQRPCCVTWRATHTHHSLSQSFLLVENLSLKWLHQLITCGKSQIFKSSVIKGLIKIDMDEDEKLAVNFAWPWTRDTHYSTVHCHCLQCSRLLPIPRLFLLRGAVLVHCTWYHMGRHEIDMT